MTDLVHIPAGPEWLVIMVIGLLIYGRNLPRVAQALGIDEIFKNCRK